MWIGRRSTDKRYPGDNRLILPKSPYRRQSLAPRCRLVASWGGSTSQGLGCSPIKAVRELGLERRTLRLHEVIRGCPPAHIGETLMSPPNGSVRAIPREGHTVRALQASYVAGFLDGDGSIHFQQEATGRASLELLLQIRPRVSIRRSSCDSRTRWTRLQP